MSKSKDYILQKSHEGIIVLPLLEGYGEMGLKEFITQPIDGILYDLDLMEEQCDLNTKEGIRRYAMAKVIRALRDIQKGSTKDNWRSIQRQCVYKYENTDSSARCLYCGLKNGPCSDLHCPVINKEDSNGHD